MNPLIALDPAFASVFGGIEAPAKPQAPTLRDAYKTHAEAARMHARALNIEAAAYRMEGKQAMADHCIAMSNAKLDIASSYDMEAEHV